MSEMLALQCASCGSGLQVGVHDLLSKLLKCPYCGTHFKLPGEPEVAPIEIKIAFNPAEPAPEPDVPMPESITQKDMVSGIEIERKWYTGATVFLVCLLAGWVLFLNFWLSQRKDYGAEWPWLTMAVLLMGCGIAYYTVQEFLNRTHISVDRRHIVVSQLPSSSREKVCVEWAQIESLFCEEETGSANLVRKPFQVCAKLRDGTLVLLVADGLERDEALYIKQQIVHALRALELQAAAESEI